MMKLKINNYSIFLVVFTLLLFNDCINFYLGGFSIIDEIYSYVGVIIAIIIYSKSKMKFEFSLNEINILILTFLLFLLGILGNFFVSYQKIGYAFVSGLSTIKFIFAYFVTRIIFCNISLNINSDKINLYLRRITIILGTIGFILNYINPNRGFDTFYGANSIIMFFSHPTYLNAFCVCLISLLTYYLKKYKKNIYYILFLMILMALTYKAKSFIFIGIYILTMINFSTAIHGRRMYILGRGILLFSGLPILFIVYKFFNDKLVYFTVVHGDTARNVLTNMSFFVAKQHFPFGSGFGTYASAMSGKYYSSLYYKLGISNIYGLVPSDPKFVADTFWPMILGENGIIGLVIFGIIIFSLIKQLILYKNNYAYWFAGLIPIIYLLVSSIAESSFANQYAVTFMVITVVINYANKEKYMDSKESEGNK